jgi:hypothetical protein
MREGLKVIVQDDNGIRTYEFKDVQNAMLFKKMLKRD